MNLSEISHRRCIIIECGNCEKKEFVFDKLASTVICACGNNDAKVLAVKDWNGADFSQVCKLELESFGLEDYVELPNDIYEKLNEIIQDKTLLREVMKVVSDNIADCLCK